jgi:hypothetical protein
MKNLVWLASYPRSGNTWFRVFLSMLLSENRNKTDLNRLEAGLNANSRILFDELAGINSSDLTSSEIDNLKPKVYELLSDERLAHIYIKTHDQYFVNDSGNPVFPDENTFGCIYFVRNPLDVAVSNAFYFNRSIDEVINLMNSNTYTLNFSPNMLLPILAEKTGSWSWNVLSWYHSDLKVHFMRYEEMISQPMKTFSKAINFLDLHYADDLISEALLNTSIEKLQKSEESGGFKEKLQGCKTFFRNGKAGNWKTELNANQIAKIITDHREVMQLFGYIDDSNKIIE